MLDFNTLSYSVNMERRRRRRRRGGPAEKSPSRNPLLFTPATRESLGSSTNLMRVIVTQSPRTVYSFRALFMQRIQFHVRFIIPFIHNQSPSVVSEEVAAAASAAATPPEELTCQVTAEKWQIKDIIWTGQHLIPLRRDTNCLSVCSGSWNWEASPRVTRAAGMRHHRRRPHPHLRRGLVRQLDRRDRGLRALAVLTAGRRPRPFRGAAWPG